MATDRMKLGRGNKRENRKGVWRETYVAEGRKTNRKEGENWERVMISTEEH